MCTSATECVHTIIFELSSIRPDKEKLVSFDTDIGPGIGRQVALYTVELAITTVSMIIVAMAALASRNLLLRPVVAHHAICRLAMPLIFIPSSSRTAPTS
eukprot:jgi/Ulvmu1/1713/UM116_0026.1